MDKSNFFFCYSKQLADFLIANGIKPITIALNPRSKDMFSMFYINKKLKEKLDEYKKINAQKGNNFLSS